MILAQYKVDEGSGTNLVDSSGNGNDATLTGTTTNWWDKFADINYFTDGAGHGVEKTQQEWVADGVMNHNKQYYIKECENSNTEVYIYKQPLTDPEDEEVLTACCVL